VRKVFVLLTLLTFGFCLSCSADEYMKRTPSAYTFKSIYDDIYVNESGDTMHGELSMGGNDLHFDSSMYFRYVDTNTLKLYIAGNLVHTWTSGAVINYAKLEDDTFMLLEDGGKTILE
jgi:hypothetical protein